MPTIAEVRQSYPQYSDMSDAQLADALHAKFYSDMPRAAFDAKVGLTSPQDAANFRRGNAFGATDELAHSATMGLARPLYAATSTLGPAVNALLGREGESPGQAYTRAEREYDAAKGAYEKASPIAATGTSLLGGVSALGKMAANAPSWVGRLWQGAKAGGVYGGTEGLAESTGSAGQRLAQGGAGLAIGSTLGAAIPAAFDVARGVTAPVRAMISAARNPEQAAARQIAQAMEDGSITTLQAQAELLRARAAGVTDMTIADVSGKNTQQLTATYAKSPGPGKQQAADFLGQRAATRGENALDVARPALGHPEQTYGAIDQLIADRAKKAAPLYERAHSTPLDTTRPEYDAIMRELDTPSGQAALASAARKMADEKVPSKMIHINVGQDGNVTLSRLPDTRTLDYVKRALDDKIQAARRAGNMDDARIFGGVKSGIVDNLDVLNPAYRSARAAFRGPSESKDAIEAGMQFLHMPPEMIRKELAALSPADREFARLGAARALKDLTGASTDQTRRLLSTNMRERMEALFPDKSSYDRAYHAWETIKRQNDLGRRVLGGSQTYENFAQAGDAAIDPGTLMHAAQGNILGLTKDALRGLANRFGGITPKIGDAGVKLLLNPDPFAQRSALDTIQRAYLRHQLQGTMGAAQIGLTGGILGLLPPPQTLLSAASAPR